VTSVNLISNFDREAFEMHNKTFILLAAVILLTTAVTGCNSKETKASATTSATTAQPATPTDDVTRISVADARAAFDSGKAVIIDVRTEPAFKAGHIKGSQLIPLSEVAARAGELPQDKTIILYCSCPAEQTSIAAAQALKGKGVENTAALVGGFPKWQDAGYPTEKSQ
jgi:rhodanese-related sulfurtransferase